MSNDKPFVGWSAPSENWSKLPHDLVYLMPDMKESELKVTLYILRHTWGFGNYEDFLPMTIDEIMNGRKIREGKRIDNGTGLSKQSVITGTKAGISRGTLEEVANRVDLARIKKGYKLRGQNSGQQGSKIWTSEVKNLDTELNKDTLKEKRSPTESGKAKKSPTVRAKFNAAMEAKFSEVSNIPLPKRVTMADRSKAGKRWNTPLWNMYDLSRPNEERLGETKRQYVEETLTSTLALIEAATIQMKADSLTLDSPASIEKVATSLHANGITATGNSNEFWDKYK